MKTKTIDIEGVVYEVREITMEEGIPLIDQKTGSLDMAGLIRAATRVNGVLPAEGAISFAASMKLMPVVMELNAFTGAAPGNV